ncbi:MAG: flagellar biosynthesis protein FlgM [Gammaproteobacteria bacterium]|nr:flagellar biosynthesis protein FlgM [Gammaproteobacteria bacterium]
MRWRKGRRSSNVEDRRGQTVRRGASVGGGAVILALIAVFFFGQDPALVLEQMGNVNQAQPQSQGRQPSAEEDQLAEFTKVVLADTEDVWTAMFRNAGSQYRQPVLVLYNGITDTAGCGRGQAAAGPFYCPADNKIYIDLSFVRELTRLGASGDFAFAYVIAHEVGHHIQNITGTARQVREAQSRTSKQGANALQVKMELQADCYAGVWAHHADRQRQILERGDVDEGLAAAASVGDDRLQAAAGRRVQPETWTHGSSKQRAQWFRQGFQTGAVDACDTFGQ